MGEYVFYIILSIVVGVVCATCFCEEDDENMFRSGEAVGPENIDDESHENGSDVVIEVDYEINDDDERFSELYGAGYNEI